MRREGSVIFALICAALIMCQAGPAEATDRYWIAGGTDWFNDNNGWNTQSDGTGSTGQPVSGDRVFLYGPGSSGNTTVYYYSDYSPLNLSMLTIDAAGTGNVTLQLGAYGQNQPLSAYSEVIGGNSAGTFTQLGATNQASNLYVGINAGSNGLYNQSAGTNTVTQDFILGYNGASGSTPAASGAYKLSGTGSLSAGSLCIGDSGAGTFTQTGGTNQTNTSMYVGYNPGSSGLYDHSAGTNTVTQDLVLGYHDASGSTPAASGTYKLSGTGSLSANNEYIGYIGTGTFTQTGGANQTNTSMYVGYNRGSSGLYDHSAGTNTVTQDFILGYNGASGSTPAASGAYKLSGTGSLSANNEYIGYSGTGTFTQTGGTNTATGSVVIAETLTATGSSYNLMGGTLTAGAITLNAGGAFSQNGGTLNAAVFNQTGGTVQGDLQNGGTFNYTSGDFQGRLVNNGVVNFNADFTAGNGMEHYTDLTIGAGRTITLNGAGLANYGSITLAGGVLTGSGALANYNYMSGYGTIGGSGGFVNQGVLHLTGNLTVSNVGSNVNYNEIDLAGPGKYLNLASYYAELSNQGAINLNGSSMIGPGTVDNSYGGVIAGNGSITGNFSNSAGTLLVSGNTNVSGAFANGGLISLTGASSHLMGGAIANTGTIQGQGTVGNSIANTGIIETRGGDLTLSGQSLVNNKGGQINVDSGNKLIATTGIAGNAGTISFNNSIFDNNGHAMSNTGVISGYGVFRTGGLTNSGNVALTGGSSTVNGDVLNQTGATVQVAYSPAVFTGAFTNYGTFKLTETKVTFANGYTEHGSYLSDPGTTSIAGNANIDTTGYWQGGIGDNWSITGGFLNNSTQNTKWDTGLSTIALTGSGNHVFRLMGTDKGAIMGGYTNNFAWGTLSITGGGSVTLTADSTSRYAQYVTTILGVTLNSGQVTNISEATGSDLNIYYLASAAGNAYLNDKIYNLTGGGELIPVSGATPGSVPLPPAVLLLAPGLAGLTAMRNRFKN